MRSAVSSWDGGVLEGTVTVGAAPAVPAAERSAAGLDPIALGGLPGGDVTVVDGKAPVAAAPAGHPTNLRPHVRRPVRSPRAHLDPTPGQGAHQRRRP